MSTAPKTATRRAAAKPAAKPAAKKAAKPAPAPKRAPISPAREAFKLYLVSLAEKAIAAGEPDLKKVAPAKLGAAVAAARANGYRWEVVALLAGKSVTAVRRAFEEQTGESYRTSYSGRGRDFRVKS
jgi:hypothetical protein